MNLKFWKRDKPDDVRREKITDSMQDITGGGFGAATGRTGSFGNMGGGGSDTPEEGDSGTRSSSGRVGSSTSGRH